VLHTLEDRKESYSVAFIPQWQMRDTISSGFQVTRIIQKLLSMHGTEDCRDLLSLRGSDLSRSVFLK